MALFKLGVFRESRDIGVLWPVFKSHGKCGCGECEMTSIIAFFVNRKDAEAWIVQQNAFKEEGKV